MHKWDAADYRNHSEAQLKLGRELIEKLGLQGGERVLDIGCGDGRVTAEIAARLPRGSADGIDNSRDMIRLARRTFPPADFPNLNFALIDAQALDFENEFDIAFSNAVLHWVSDHQAVLKGIYRALKPGGRLLVQMGGRGNVDGMVNIALGLASRPEWAAYFRDFIPPFSFFGVEEYQAWLPRAGFRPLRVELIRRDMQQQGREGLEGWFRTTWHPFIHRVPEGKRQAYIDEAAGAYLRIFPADPAGIVHIAAVRLEVEAVKE